MSLVRSRPQSRIATLLSASPVTSRISSGRKTLKAIRSNTFTQSTVDSRPRSQRRRTEPARGRLREDGGRSLVPWRTRAPRAHHRALRRHPEARQCCRHRRSRCQTETVVHVRSLLQAACQVGACPGDYPGPILFLGAFITEVVFPRFEVVPIGRSFRANSIHRYQSMIGVTPPAFTVAMRRNGSRIESSCRWVHKWVHKRISWCTFALVTW